MSVLGRQHSEFAGTASRIEPNLASRPVKAICASSRASGAPRQWWMPCPNARCPELSRPRSSRSGSPKRDGSRGRQRGQIRHSHRRVDEQAPVRSSSADDNGRRGQRVRTGCDAYELVATSTPGTISVKLPTGPVYHRLC